MTAWPREPEILAYIEKSNAIVPDAVWEGGVDEQRKGYGLICAAFRQARPEGLESRDLSIDQGGHRIPVRLYKPARLKTQGLIVYFHGGGFVVGDLDSHDDICADISHQTGAALLAVDYRLAPEHLYPAALEDCVAAVNWARAEAGDLGIDPTKIVLAGDSAGAKLSAGVTHKLRDGAGDQVQGQVLIYGAYGGDMTKGSYVEHAEAPMLTAASCRHYFDLYSGGGKVAIDHYMKPLTAEQFGGLPPAYISVAEFDPLRDDSFAYAEKLSAAGVPVTLKHEPQMVHSYLRARWDSPGAREAFQGICQAIREMLAG